MPRKTSCKSKRLHGWKVGPHYKLEKFLGEGSYGQVARAVDLRTGNKVAIKKIEGVFDDVTDCKRFIREVRLLKELRHPCITQLIEILVPENDV